MKAKYLVLDVANREAVATSFKNLEPEWQAIEILVNNAGTARGFQKLHEGELDDWDDMIDINIKGPSSVSNINGCLKH